MALDMAHNADTALGAVYFAGSVATVAAWQVVFAAAAHALRTGMHGALFCSGVYQVANQVDPSGRPGEPFARGGKQQVWTVNSEKYDGSPTCEQCGTPVVRPQQHTKGTTPPSNEGLVDRLFRSQRVNREPRTRVGWFDAANFPMRWFLKRHERNNQPLSLSRSSSVAKAIFF